MDALQTTPAVPSGTCSCEVVRPVAWIVATGNAITPRNCKFCGAEIMLTKAATGVIFTGLSFTLRYSGVTLNLFPKINWVVPVFTIFPFLVSIILRRAQQKMIRTNHHL